MSIKNYGPGVSERADESAAAAATAAAPQLSLPKRSEYVGATVGASVAAADVSRRVPTGSASGRVNKH